MDFGNRRGVEVRMTVNGRTDEELWRYLMKSLASSIVRLLANGQR